MHDVIPGISGTGTNSDPYLYGTFAELQTIVNGAAVDDRIFLRQTANISTATWTTLDLSRYNEFHVNLNNHELKLTGTNLYSTVMFVYNTLRYHDIYFHDGRLETTCMVIHDTASAQFIPTVFTNMTILCTGRFDDTVFRNAHFSKCGLTLDTGWVLSAPMIVVDVPTSTTTNNYLINRCNVNVHVQGLNGYPVIDVVSYNNRPTIQDCYITGTLKCNAANIPTALFAKGIVYKNSVADIDVTRIRGSAYLIQLLYTGTASDHTGAYNKTSSYNATDGTYHTVSMPSSTAYEVEGLTYNELTTVNVMYDNLTNIIRLSDDDPVPTESTYRWGMYRDEMPFLIDVLPAPEYPVQPDPYAVSDWYIVNGNAPYMPDFPTMVDFPPPFPHVFIGDDPVDKIYRGDREITTIYVGSTKL